jgi:tetratricopeptide (TPR) repeat protein
MLIRQTWTSEDWVQAMPEHGHEDCPHCDATLQGSEATCPACSGPLFGIAVKKKESEPNGSPETDSVTQIDDIAVPTYTPPVIEMVEAEETVEADPTPAPFVGEIQEEMTAEEYILQGETLGREGLYAEAIRQFNQAIAVDPSNHMAWFNRGVMNEALGDVQEAVKAFRIALDNHAGHGATSANLAVLLQRMGHGDDAASHAQNGLLAFPGHPALLDIVNSAGAEVPVTPIHVEETEAVDAAAPEPEAEPIEDDGWAAPSGFVQTLDAPPQVAVEPTAAPAGIDLDALSDAAADMIRSGDAASALESLREHLPAAAADHARCWRIAAGAMARLDLPDNAIEAFAYSLDIDGSDAPTWFNMGALKRRGGDFVGGMVCFRNAVDLDPNYAKAQNGLAQGALEQGDIETSITAFRALLALDPAHTSGAIFAELLIDLSEGEGRVLELDESLPTTLPAGPEMAAEALQHLPAEATALRARAHSMCGQHAESVTLWKSLLEADKSNPDAWIGLARALTAAGSDDKAAACRQKARDLGADVAPEAVVEAVAEPLPDDSVETEPESQTVSDPWAEFETSESDSEPAVEITPAEIVHYESALDTVSDPEPVTYEPVSEAVDLAAAALEAQSHEMEEYEVRADSSSIANQDTEWYNKGLELLGKDRYKEALGCFDRALPSFKDDKGMAIKILNGRGNCYYYLDEYKQAIENYYKAFSIDKALTTGNALYNMGTAYAELESYDNAIHCFEQSMGKEVGEPLKGENKKRGKEQIRRCKLLLKELKKRS